MHGLELDLPGFAPEPFCYLGDHGPVTAPLQTSGALDSRYRWSLLYKYLHEVAVRIE